MSLINLLINLPIDIKYYIIEYLKISKKGRLNHLKRLYPNYPINFLQDKVNRGLNYNNFKLIEVIYQKDIQSNNFNTTGLCILGLNSMSSNQ